jgi:hypothetical protein
MFKYNSGESYSKLKELNVIRKDQYGFKESHCTTHAWLRLTESMTHGFNNSKPTLALFLDIERAFDKMWITGLISRHIVAAVPAHLTQQLHSCLNNKSLTAVDGKAAILCPAGGPSCRDSPG